jgi:AraC family transcriptional regulator
VEDRALSATAMKLHGLLDEDAPSGSLYLDLLTQILMVELHRFSGRVALTPKGGLTRSAERRIREFIAANLDQDIQLDELAGMAGLSRYHFSRAFADSFGTPPHRYLIQERIARAKAMLAASDAAITEIGLAVGFSTPSHFAATFREMAGLSPSAYRRAHRI